MPNQDSPDPELVLNSTYSGRGRLSASRALRPIPGITTYPSGMAKALSSTGVLSVAVTCISSLPSIAVTETAHKGLDT